MKILLVMFFTFIYLLGDMSVNEAWQSMQAKNDGFKASKDGIKVAKLKKESATSMYLPEISISASYAHLDKPVNIDTTKVSMALAKIGQRFPRDIDLTKQDIFVSDLNLLWPLYTGGKIDAAQDIYKAGVSEAEALHQMQEDKSFLELIKIYYGVVVSDSLYHTRLQAQDALTKHYENAQKLKDAGQIAKIELLDAKVKLDSAKIKTTKAKHKHQIASSALHLMSKLEGLPLSKLFIGEDGYSEQRYIDETTKNYAALHLLDAKSAQTKAFIKIEESAWHPQVLGFGNYNLYRDDSMLMEPLPKWMAGIIIKIDLLNRADRSQEIQAAKLLSSKVHYLKLQAQEDLKILVEKTYKEMLLYRDEYSSLNSSIELAKENYKLREIAFSEAFSTSVEVVDAQLFLAATKTSRLNAAYNYVKKVSQLCVLSGDYKQFFDIAKSSQEIE